MIDLITGIMGCIGESNFNACASDSVNKLESDAKKKMQKQFIETAKELSMLAYTEEMFSLYVIICFIAGLLIVLIIHCVCMRQHPEKYIKNRNITVIQTK